MSLTDRIKYAQMKARHVKALRPWYQKWWGIFILIIIALVLIIAVASGFYIADKVKEINQQKIQNYTTEQKQLYLQAIKGDGTNYYLGSNNPLVTIVEFSDFACPYCQASYSGLRVAAEKYPDKLKIIFRDYPLHDNSVDLALAARCAGEQGKFWEFHDALFANQDKLAETGDALKVKLLSLAEDRQLKTAPFETCLTDKKYLEQIKQDFTDGETLQIQGTPTWFINNYQLTGQLTEAKLLELIGGLIK